MIDWAQERTRNLVALIIVWAASLILSIASITISCYVVARDRIDWDCSKNGHCYEGRYEEATYTSEDVRKVAEAFSDDHPSYKQQALDRMSSKRYVRDVCKYCGATIKREGNK